MSVMDESMTPKEAAPFLKISTWMLYDMVRKKQIPHFKVRSKIFFRKSALEQWVLDQEAASVAGLPFAMTEEPAARFKGH